MPGNEPKLPPAAKGKRYRTPFVLHLRAWASVGERVLRLAVPVRPVYMRIGSHAA